MSTHNVFLLIQYITVSVLFVEILIVFIRWKNPVHSYLLLTCITSFISNMGYLLEMQAGSEEAYVTALKLSYLGRVWIVFAFFMFSAKMCRIRIPKGLTAFLVLVHIGIYITVLTIGSNRLYYTDYRFIPDPLFPQFIHGNGYAHDLLMASNVILIIFAMGWVVRTYRREKNRTARMRFLMLILAFGVQAASFVLHMTAAFRISQYYDLSMPGALFGTIFMLIGIFGFDLLGTREIARDFVIDRISEGIIALDNEGRIQYFNEPVAKLYPEFDTFFSMKMGLAGKKRNGKDTEDPGQKEKEQERHLTPYDIIAGIGEAVKKGETLTINDRIYTPEENELKFRDISYGKLYALVDDTEHYRYMEELQEQKDIADRANAAKSRFLASMSHEIRTPINAVLGMDEMILRESTEKPIRDYASDIMSAGRTLLSLINDILDLSKVEEGKMEIIPVQYDLSSLINDLSNMIRDRALKKGLKFTVRADGHIPHLLIGDEIRIRQCVMNILTNAVKYTETGEVTMEISHEKKGRDCILLRFRVEDTGIGMKKEDMETLFSPYKRFEEKRNRSIEGTGLGMSITRQLLDLMGSTLEVESEYGKGSVFSFGILQEVSDWEEIGDCAARFGDASGSRHEYHELFHAPEASILVVDDTEMNLTVIKSLLKKTRIHIDTAASGREALELAKEHSYDAVFVDHMMPDMDGIETLKHLRESGKCMEAPVVVLTANAVSGARQMYLEAGFTNYLSKPVDGEKLERMLYDMLPSGKLIDPDKDTGALAGEGTDNPGKDAEGSSNGDPAESFLSVLKELPDIDEQAGLKNCGSGEGYLSVLTVFHQTAPAKADEIEKFLESGDIENYTIRVHALKSSARIIGASELSALAKELEDAGKRQDTGYIRDNTGHLLEMYRALDKDLARLDKTDESLPEIGDGEMKEAYQTIGEIAQSMDYEMMDGLLKDLRGYRLPDGDKKRISEIEKMLTELDWDGIIRTAGEVL
ncbi:MAG: response regulator [Lachnospiraceae bacterium]|nr:response regulator [Lachnospiraceae bacterium]